MLAQVQPQKSSVPNSTQTLRIHLVHGRNRSGRSQSTGWMLDSETDSPQQLSAAIRKEAVLNGVANPTQEYLNNAVASVLASYAEAHARWELERVPRLDIAFVWDARLPTSGVTLLFADSRVHGRLTATLDKYEAYAAATTAIPVSEDAAPALSAATPEPIRVARRPR